MMMASISTLIIVSVAILSGVLIAYMTLTTTDDVKATADQPEQPYVKIGKWTCPDTTLVTVTKEQFPPVKVPTYIPDGYRPIDCYYYQGSDLEMYFLHENIDPNDKSADPAVINSYTIKFYAGWFGDYPESLEVFNTGIDEFKTYKEHSSRSDFIQIFYINGNPAMGWESGLKNSIAILDGKVIDSMPLPYPATIAMKDMDAKVYYGVSAYLPLDELKKILESLEEP
jgi:hypothetical protein